MSKIIAETWHTFVNATGMYRPVLLLSVTALVAKADTIYGWYLSKFSPKNLASYQEAGHMIWGFPSWMLGLLFLALWLLILMWSHAIKLQRQLTPKLDISFDPNDAVFVHKTYFGTSSGQPDHERPVMYFSVRPQALTGATVRGCIGYLDRVWKLGPDKNWVPTSFTDRGRLEWGARGIVKLQIDTITTQVLNIFRVSKEDPIIRPLVQAALHKNADLFDNRSDVFKMDIVVIADNSPPSTISLRVEYGETWDDVKVERI